MPGRKTPEWASLEHERTGLLGRALPLSSLLVPERLQLDGDLLCYGPLANPKVLKPDHDLLDRFLRLKTPDDVLTFARRYGPLHVCQHGFQLAKCPDGCRAQEVRRLRSQGESLVHWTKTVEVAQAILRLATACREGDLGNLEDCLAIQAWCYISDRGELDPSSDMMRGFGKALSVKLRRTLVSWAVNRWITLADVRPHFSWTAEEPAIQLYSIRGDFYNRATISGHENDDEVWRGLHPSVSLFGALGLQVMYAVARTEGTTTCTACANSFFAVRQRARSRDKYCPDCGREAAVRAAKRRFRERQRQREEVQTQQIRRGGRHGK